MAVLARDSPLKGPLQLGDWARHLLYFAADAAAAGDWMLASRALDGFAAAAIVICHSTGRHASRHAF